jgi:hypothetical protein
VETTKKPDATKIAEVKAIKEKIVKEQQTVNK